MPGDSLLDLIDTARRQLPDVSDDVWKRFEAAIRGEHGTTRVYIAAHRKARHLQAIASAGEDDSPAAIAKRLGVSVRRVQQLAKLCKKPQEL